MAETESSVPSPGSSATEEILIIGAHDSDSVRSEDEPTVNNTSIASRRRTSRTTVQETASNFITIGETLNQKLDNVISALEDNVRERRTTNSLLHELINVMKSNDNTLKM
ncbi:hypothetical protein Zmor_015039 [Zophobas morio]|uniref:Uncharacterized protein n=1 Tax=Zophobas morio TaxID=2755281 RepID=A0AA38ILD2_9CUCU|nr:hypothetical protein Zmor_015039 [Zophobas morio]